jgi:hypothetical protein
MSSTKKVLNSLHGKLVGMSHDKKLVVNGRVAVTMDDTGAMMLVQGAPATCNATATMLASDLLAGIVTSTSAAAVAATVPTGTNLDAAAGLGVNEAFEWCVINTGPNTVTVTANTDHTLVGTATVATATCKWFRSRKTAAHTFVTYCM